MPWARDGFKVFGVLFSVYNKLSSCARPGEPVGPSRSQVCFVFFFFKTIYLFERKSMHTGEREHKQGE